MDILKGFPKKVHLGVNESRSFVEINCANRRGFLSEWQVDGNPWKRQAGE